MSRRLENWPELLNSYIAEQETAPFVWGEHDCCLFVCNVIQLLTGIDPAKDYRNRYKTKAGATRLLAKAGGLEALAVAVCADMEFVEIGVNFCQRGDLVLMDCAEEQALGICLGANAAFVTLTGFTYYPLSKCCRAWRVS